VREQEIVWKTGVSAEENPATPPGFRARSTLSEGSGQYKLPITLFFSLGFCMAD